MKKLMVTTAIVLGGLTSFAAPALAFTQLDAAVITAQQEEYKEIKTEELPQAVKDALAADFQTATLDKAFVNEKLEYKLEITVDGAASTVYADEEGNWIEKE